MCGIKSIEDESIMTESPDSFTKNKSEKKEPFSFYK